MIGNDVGGNEESDVSTRRERSNKALTRGKGRWEAKRIIKVGGERGKRGEN